MDSTATWDTERAQLLGRRISELELAISGSRVERLVARLYDELAERGIAFRPPVYLSDQWGCPDGTPLIGVPFYLADARLERIEAELVTDSLVHRYHADGSDGFDEPEGTFNLCSFWYVEALTRAGRLDQARHTFEKMLTYANHLGLYAEEIGPSGEALGNFPQAFTHLALIEAALTLADHRSPRGVRTRT